MWYIFALLPLYYSVPYGDSLSRENEDPVEILSKVKQTLSQINSICNVRVNIDKTIPQSQVISIIQYLEVEAFELFYAVVNRLPKKVKLNKSLETTMAMAKELYLSAWSVDNNEDVDLAINTLLAIDNGIKEKGENKDFRTVDMMLKVLADKYFLKMSTNTFTMNDEELSEDMKDIYEHTCKIVAKLDK